MFDREGGPTLAGAIELLSPSNKDRPANRDAFVTKCAAYIQQGIGLVVVDVVTDRHSDWHDELLKRLGWTGEMKLDADLSAAAYRPVDHSGQASLDIWQERLRARAGSSYDAALAARQPLPAGRPGSDLRPYLPRAQDQCLNGRGEEEVAGQRPSDQIR